MTILKWVRQVGFALKQWIGRRSAWQVSLRLDERDKAEMNDEDVPGSVQAAFPDLTPREKQIVRLIQRGYSNKEVAHELGISVSTVKWNMTNILGKFGVDTSKQLIARLSEEDSARLLDQDP